MRRMPADVDLRPKSKHFGGPVVLEFRLMKERRPALSLRFEEDEQAKAFRKGFRIASRHELQKFEFECEWMTAGANFFTPWTFFAETWDLEPVPFLVIGYEV